MESYNKFILKKLNQLSGFAKDKLEITQSGIYKYKGKEYKKDYILPVERKELNLIAPFNTKSCLADLQKNYKLHNYYHHLNSSQILAFNYFMPFFKTDEFGIGLKELSDIFNKLLNENLVIEKLTLEQESQLETIYLKGASKKLKGNTTFDAFFNCKDKKTVSIEVKYTEYGFGGCKNDNHHQQKFQNCYKKCIDKNKINRYINSKYLKEDFFLKNYQLMRNLIHLSNDNQIVVFLFPKGNVKINGEVGLIKDIIIDPLVLNRVIILYWEELIEETLLEVQKYARLSKYYGELKEKYFSE